MSCCRVDCIGYSIDVVCASGNCDHHIRECTPARALLVLINFCTACVVVCTVKVPCGESALSPAESLCM